MTGALLLEWCLQQGARVALTQIANLRLSNAQVSGQWLAPFASYTNSTL